ncbi:hypothetical protein NE604_03815 [Anaerofustis stercorihominis]|uniref:hypothetical protein n=1 Tax=Anaerofustis stercorihominis TaxID=214853 RepID=UPI0018DDB088|nr:hypothetical protein [Anaerofustis stercorihominis]MCQ4794768.1 hypothetical protein [Anaerofustis stercorihominis]
MPSFGITAIPNGGIFATTTIFGKSVIPNKRTFGITLLSNNPIFTTNKRIFYDYRREEITASQAPIGGNRNA